MRAGLALAVAAACTAAAPVAPAFAELHRVPPRVAPRKTAAADDITRELYLDRCTGGCTITATTDRNDATSNTTSVTDTDATYQLAAFAYTDAEWQQIVACVQQVYSPFAVAVTDAVPTGVYNKAIVAGLPEQMGLDGDTLGIALIDGDCNPLADFIAFAFANAHPHDATFVDNVCWTVAQESAHLYGLDHEYVFTDGVSACSDPMTYRTDCGGEKFFRPQEAFCGTVAETTCRCSAAQSSDRLLRSRLGSATPTTSAPSVALVQPTQPGAIAAGDAVIATASAQRGVAQVSLLLNGFAWATAPGVAFGADGQPASPYTLTVPADVPDGIIDVAVTAEDDLGIATTTPVITMMKGSACADASTCAADQRCDAGRCEWPPATLALGEACAYPQACTSGLCASGACTQACDIDDPTTCPSGYACAATNVHTEGQCVAAAAVTGGASWCAAGGGDRGGMLAVGFALIALTSSRSRTRSRSGTACPCSRSRRTRA